MAGRNPIRLIGLILCLALLVGGASAASTEVRVVKLANDGTTVLAERTVDYQWLGANLPVKGDGSTHYYHQGPTFDDANLWDPAEEINVEDEDMGAVKGTALRDLCGLAGGMSSGDSLVVRATDGVSMQFSYGTVYSPPSRQGQMVLTWYRADDGYVPSYYSGMRIVFFADTSVNPWGRHVFGNSDMQASMPSSEWTYYNRKYPTTTQLSIRYVNELVIRSTQPPPTTATSRPTTVTSRPTTASPTTAATASPLTQATSIVPTTGTVPAGTTIATPAPTASGLPTGAAPPAENTTPAAVPSGDTGPDANVTTGVPADATGTVTIDPAANLTGDVTPVENWTTIPTAPPLETTYSYSATEPTSDIDDGGAATTTTNATNTTTPTPTASPRASAAPPAVVTAGPPPPAFSPAPTATSANPLFSFVISFEVRENGINTTYGSSGGASSSSPLVALWAFVKALVNLIDTAFI